MKNLILILMCFLFFGCNHQEQLPFIKDPRVLVVVVTKDYVRPECWQSILIQDYDNYSTLVHVMKPRLNHKNHFMAKSMNVADNKEIARRLALASDADYFFFVDSSVVLPLNAISELVKQLGAGPASPQMVAYVEKALNTKCAYMPKHAIAGYNPFKEDNSTFIMGRFVADNLITYLRKVEPSVTRIDFASGGCLMMDRFLLSKLKWRAGIDKYVRTVDGNFHFLDDSLDLCNQIASLGFQLWADGSVVCKHLGKKNE